MHSSAVVRSGKASGMVVRRNSVVQRAPKPSLAAALAMRLPNGVAPTAAKSSGGVRSVAGSVHSCSARAASPPPAALVAAPLTVWIQRRPAWRMRTAMPSRARRQSTVSKYVLDSDSVRARPRFSARTTGWRRSVATAPRGSRSLSSISCGPAAIANRYRQAAARGRAARVARFS
jgi:hypothetical protein